MKTDKIRKEPLKKTDKTCLFLFSATFLLGIGLIAYGGFGEKDLIISIGGGLLIISSFIALIKSGIKPKLKK